MCFSTAVREVIARSSVRGPRGSSFCAFGANASPSVATAADSAAVRFILGMTAFFVPCGDARARETSHAGVCGRAHDCVLITAFIFHFRVAATSFRRFRRTMGDV
jgi:hypothetical protein